MAEIKAADSVYETSIGSLEQCAANLGSTGYMLGALDSFSEPMYSYRALLVGVDTLVQQYKEKLEKDIASVCQGVQKLKDADAKTASELKSGAAGGKSHRGGGIR